MTTRKNILAAVLALVCLFAVNSFAQDKAKGKAKSYTFHGKVTAVTEKGLTVNGEKVDYFVLHMAHGDLTLSLIEHLRPQLIRNTGVKMGINYGFDKVRFPAAVPAGSRIRARAEVASVKELGDGWWHVVTKFTVEGEGQDKPVCVAESVGRALIG